MRHFCVFECRVGGGQVVWAWCLLSTGPGFDSVSFTTADGCTPIDAVPDYQLGKHLFTALVDVGETR